MGNGNGFGDIINQKSNFNTAVSTSNVNNILPSPDKVTS